jgi:hypothetical protein
MMTPAEIRLKQNPILTSLMLGMGQGTMIAEQLFPRLPQALSSVTLAKGGDERLRRYNLRRTPGAPTKRINIKFEGKTYTVDKNSVEVPLPRELFREADESKKLNVGAYLDLSKIATTTSMAVLGLAYELDVAELATAQSTYASGHVMALTGADKWSAATGTPVTDIAAASDIVRKKIGMRPNKLTLSADAFTVVKSNPEVKSSLPSTQTGSATLEQLKTIFNVEEVIVGDAVWIDGNDEGMDVWGNNAILAYVPKIGASGLDFSLTEPAFGLTNVLEGHPFAETPYYSAEYKSWIYGGTFERRPNVAYDNAAFLFANPK